MKRGKRLEFESLIQDRVYDWFISTSGELPEGFPATYGIRKAWELHDGSDEYCDWAWSGICEAVNAMSPGELRLWAQRLQNIVI